MYILGIKLLFEVASGAVRLACERGHAKLVQMLLGEYGMSPDARKCKLSAYQIKVELCQRHTYICTVHTMSVHLFITKRAH